MTDRLKIINEEITEDDVCAEIKAIRTQSGHGEVLVSIQNGVITTVKPRPTKKAKDYRITLPLE